MTIVERIKKLIVAKGGDPSGISDIGQGIAKLEAIENAANPLSALTVDTEIGASENLLGKVIGDLQKDIVVGPHTITGTLKNVTGYTGFSGDTIEQSGHYLAVHASVPDVDGETIKIKTSVKAGEKTLDSDGILIFRITEQYIKDGVTLTFIASKTGNVTFSKTYDLSKLVLAPAST